MPEFAIREALIPDLPILRALMEEYGAHLIVRGVDIPVEGYRAELDALPGPYAAPAGALLLAERLDGHALGCVALKPLQLAGRDEHPCELKRLWVRPEARGLGLGRALMLAALDHAETLGYTALYLDTAPAAMPEAQALYARLGFVEVSRYNDNPVAGIVFFRRELASR